MRRFSRWPTERGFQRKKGRRKSFSLDTWWWNTSQKEEGEVHFLSKCVFNLHACDFCENFYIIWTFTSFRDIVHWLLSPGRNNCIHQIIIFCCFTEEMQTQRCTWDKRILIVALNNVWYIDKVLYWNQLSMTKKQNLYITSDTLLHLC